MLPRTSAFFAASLDGFIAREDGSLDWLDAANAAVPPCEDCGYAAFSDSIDALVMGRRTYEKVLTYGAWPYGDKRVVVMSSAGIAFPADLPGTVSCSSESPRALLERLASDGVRHVYVDGGATIRGFLAAGLLDRITVTIVPVLLGGGISPFAGLPHDVGLTRMHAEVYGFGFVQVTYAVTGFPR